VTRIALTAPADDDGQARRPGRTLQHCHLPQATPDCPTCVAVHGPEWAARQLEQRAAAAQARDARAAARVAAAARTRRAPASGQAADDDAGSGWRSGWDIDPASDRGQDDGWGDSA
jgi:hypothetical protein